MTDEEHIYWHISRGNPSRAPFEIGIQGIPSQKKWEESKPGLVSVLNLSQKMPTEQKTWEYRIVQDTLDEAHLPELGDGGWELTSVISREDTELWVFKKLKE